MTSKSIREKFQAFFESKKHEIVASAPMIVKDDPTLMFTNAGMNQFKDIFLGEKEPKSIRVANTQKCLRVSGKHNDLEEVGHDTYHHTMFEMLGNWSFGDYFKEEAVDWAWEFLTGWMGIDPDRLYATVFEGSKEDQLVKDEEAFNYWKKHLDVERILNGSKKDNFWEMGETGPCGPCSEVHVDLRDDSERKQVDGLDLVNKNHPLVIEIWNLVFIQYNRKADGSLVSLPQKHVDTGMGFERLCMAIQGVKSNYDTDIFQPIIKKIAAETGFVYGTSEQTDIAMRVVADHLRAVAFSICDGQLPSNTGAGYVIRRILRRSVRYAYTFLNVRKPFLAKLYLTLIEVMGDAFPELESQKDLAKKVITEEEVSFLKTLETGITRLDQVIADALKNNLREVSGKVAFELYDTYGFPLDLTQLILAEKKMSANLNEFNQEMDLQKNRSRSAQEQQTGDWTLVHPGDKVEFVGYDHMEVDIKITKYRSVKTSKKTLYNLVFNKTPFYAESGGQVGDTGYIEHDGEKISIKDTQKENNLIVHITDKLPKDPSASFRAIVNSVKRIDTKRHHSATHLLHFALRSVLGNHVEQKGSLVSPDYLRFDFSHYQKVTADELLSIEKAVNQMILENFPLQEKRDLPMAEAKKLGAMALFGEKYGDHVRVIQFGNSIELCGGTHVQATGELGLFKILSEGSIAAGIRRIEAISGLVAENYYRKQDQIFAKLAGLLKNNTNIPEAVSQIIEENARQKHIIEKFENEQLNRLKKQLLNQIKTVNDFNVIKEIVNLNDSGQIRDLAFQLHREQKRLILLLGAVISDKPNLSIMITDDLVSEKGWNAGTIVREAAKLMQGGGGGQPFFATAGGKNPNGLNAALDKALELLNNN